MTDTTDTPALSDSFVRNCWLLPRRGDTVGGGTPDCLFVSQMVDGEIITTARLDGYAILPVEEYKRLVSFVPFSDKSTQRDVCDVSTPHYHVEDPSTMCTGTPTASQP